MRSIRFVLSSLLIALVLMVTNAVFAQTPIAVGDTVEGTRTDADVDYSISLEAGQLIFVTVTAPEFDSNVTILDAGGAEVAFDDDSAGDRNPYLAFFVPVSGEYIIRVGAFLGTGSGAYTLSVTAGEVTPLTLSTPIDIAFTGAPIFYSFEANAGDVVTIAAVNENFVTADLSLSGPDGVEVANNSNVFFGSRQLRRVELPLSGLYSLRLSSYSVSDVAETLVLTVTSDTLLSLDSGPVTVTLETDVLDFDVVRFTVTAGTTYVLSAVTDNPEKGVSVDFVLGVDEFGFNTTGGFSFRYASAGTVEIVPANDGVLTFIVSEEGFFSMEEKPSNITLTIAPK
ncbi:MAG: hypothetical protein MUE54_14030 [Anaerolineae bacterium]|jgi:hypothetical protein|nr:hypothetical protein [Anaerolineae bacterium]